MSEKPKSTYLSDLAFTQKLIKRQRELMENGIIDKDPFWNPWYSGEKTKSKIIPSAIVDKGFNEAVRNNPNLKNIFDIEDIRKQTGVILYKAGVDPFDYPEPYRTKKVCNWKNRPIHLARMARLADLKARDLSNKRFIPQRGIIIRHC